MVEAALRTVAQDWADLPKPLRLSFPSLPVETLAATQDRLVVRTPGFVEVRSLANGVEFHRYEVSTDVSTVVFTRDCSSCVCLASESLYVLDLNSGTVKVQIGVVRDVVLKGLALQDTCCVLWWDEGNMMTILQMPTLQKVAALPLPDEIFRVLVGNLAYASGPNYFVKIHQKEVSLWKLEGISTSAPLLEGGNPNQSQELKQQWAHSNTNKFSCLLALESSFITGSENGEISLWTIDENQSATVSYTLVGHRAAVKDLQLTSDGQYLLALTNFSSLWDLKTKTLLGSYPRKPHLFLVPGTHLYVSSEEESIHVDSLDLQYAPPRDNPGNLSGDVLALTYGKASQELAWVRFPGNFNSLQVCVVYRLYDQLGRYLRQHVPVLHSSVGSILDLTSGVEGREVAGVVVKYLEEIMQNGLEDDILLGFYPFVEDALLFVDLVLDSSDLTIPFFSMLMLGRPGLSNSINLPSSFEAEFNNCEAQQIDREALIKKAENQFGLLDTYIKVEFSGSMLPFCMVPGSSDSISLLEKLEAFYNRKVLNTPFVASLIRSKWTSYYHLTLIMTLIFVLSIANFVCLQFEYTAEEPFRISFLVLLVVGYLYERFQLLAEGYMYLFDPINYIDFGRISLSVVWVMRGISGKEEVLSLSFAVAALTLLRGFTYFRSFALTRKYVYITKAVVLKTYTFLIVLAYSACSFGVLSAILQQKPFSEALSNALAFTLGGADNSDYNEWLWFLFLAAVFINIIVMMNLLISILGDAFGKVNETLEENDLHLQLTLILEYERMLAGHRPDSKATYLHCMQVSQPPEDQDKILSNTEHIAEDSKTIMEKLQHLEADMAHLKAHLLKQ